VLNTWNLEPIRGSIQGRALVPIIHLFAWSLLVSLKGTSIGTPQPSDRVSALGTVEETPNPFTRIADAIGGRLGWSRQTTMFAISASLFAHLVVLVIAALIIRPAPMASASDGRGEVPMAISTDTELSETMEMSLAEASPQMSDLNLDDLFDNTEIELPASSLDLSALDLSELGEIGGAGDIDSDSGSSIFESGSGGAASFFGIESSGNRFAYIVDISGSMQGQRIEALKRELTRSIMGLRSQSQFSIILFSSDAYPLGPSGWRSATDATKRQARSEIASIQVRGGTVPMPAFDIVFSMQPPPDAIYFMTDGIFANATGVAAEIARLNRSSGRLVPVHCITFMERDAEEIMKVIARQSGGSYTHVSSSDAP